MKPGDLVTDQPGEPGLSKSMFGVGIFTLNFLLSLKPDKKTKVRSEQTYMP